MTNYSYSILALLAGLCLVVFLLRRQKRTEQTLHSAKIQIRLMEAWGPTQIKPIRQPEGLRLPN